MGINPLPVVYGGLALRGTVIWEKSRRCWMWSQWIQSNIIIGYWRVFRGEDGKVISRKPIGTSEGINPEDSNHRGFLLVPYVSMILKGS